jgi:hypothetical protein
MLELPKIPYKMEKNQRQSIALRGINFSNMITDGDIVDSKNISARAYPYLTTRKSRASVGDYSGVTAMTVFRESTKKWHRKQYLLRADGIGAPLAFEGLSYRFAVVGKVKRT